MNNTRGVSPVIAISLLLVVAVIAGISVQNWMQGFQSEVLTDVESSQNSKNSKIQSLIDDTLYFNNFNNQNTSIDKINVGGSECSISYNLSRGMNEINISSCLEGKNDSITEVSVFTNNGVYSQTLQVQKSKGGSAFNQSNVFISVWNVSIDEGVSGFNNITLPLQSNGNYDFVVDWGDGNTARVTSYNDSDKNHTYSTGGEYTIELAGTIDGFAFNAGSSTSDNQEDGDKLIEIQQWGNLKLANTGDQFSHAENFNINSTDNPDLSGITDMSRMFDNAADFNHDISDWNTSGVVDMSFMFKSAYSFNQPLDGLNVSSVENMYQMFRLAYNFNQPLNSWDVSNVTNMRAMFHYATDFNGNISSWNTSNVEDMYRMFRTARSFNHSLNDWDTSSVTNMESTFEDMPDFNQPLDKWDVSGVTNMANMFQGASIFNQNISGWNTSQVTNMGDMFKDASAFNHSLNSWDTSKVTDMEDMFYSASFFNQNISGWNVSSVTNMNYMFRNATNFNQDISSWCVSQIGSKPTEFDLNAGFQGQTSLQPQWGTCPGESYEFSDTISSDTQNYNLYDEMVLSGWDESTPVNAQVTIDSSTWVGSGSVSNSAFVVNSLPENSQVEIINNGYIAGAGGTGGDVSDGTPTNGQNGGVALELNYDTTIDNNGQINGGGGGGASAYAAFVNTNCNPPTADFAASGGGGAGYNTGSAGSISGTYSATDSGSSGSRTSGGSGSSSSGNSACASAGASGGAGGNPGSSGGSASASYNPDGTSATSSPGSAGAAIDGNSYATFTTTGTINGPQIN